MHRGGLQKSPQEGIKVAGGGGTQRSGCKPASRWGLHTARNKNYKCPGKKKTKKNTIAFNHNLWGGGDSTQRKGSGKRKTYRQE